jgi:hypothetical protein
VTDPIESLIVSAIEVTRAYVQAHLVDREALAGYQESNDALMALQTLKERVHDRRGPYPGDGAAAVGRRVSIRLRRTDRAATGQTVTGARLRCVLERGLSSRERRRVAGAARGCLSRERRGAGEGPRDNA